MDTSDPKAVTVWLTRAIAYVAYAFLVVSEAILLQGFLLKLFGADPSSSYVQWAYRSLDRVMAPFRGIFTPIEIDGNAVLDTSILFAMVIYGIVALMVRAFLDWLTHRLEKMERERQIEAAQAAAQAAAAYPATGYPQTTGAYQQAPAPQPQRAPAPQPQQAPAPQPQQAAPRPQQAPAPQPQQPPAPQPQQPPQAAPQQPRQAPPTQPPS